MRSVHAHTRRWSTFVGAEILRRQGNEGKGDVKGKGGEGGSKSGRGKGREPREEGY